MEPPKPKSKPAKKAEKKEAKPAEKKAPDTKAKNTQALTATLSSDDPEENLAQAKT